MKIYVFPADDAGCGHYRLYWPAKALKSQGYDIVIVPPKARGANLQASINADGELVDVLYPPDADVIILQRITHIHLIAAIKIMRQRGVAVVVDIDDDLSAIHPANPAFTILHPKNGVRNEHNWHNAQGACEAATLVTVSTDGLLRRYGTHGHGRVLRNCVPESYLKIPHVDSPVVGWGGSLHSHPDDPQVMGAAIQRLTRDGVKFKVIGSGAGLRNALGLSEDPEATGVVDLNTEWPQALTTLGIGVAPLADTLFNKSKSRLKPLEYAAVGVPCVMSPRADYVQINKLGIGALADSHKQWYRRLHDLVTNETLRREFSESSRQAAAQLTIESNAWRWAEAWTEAYDMEHQVSTAQMV